MYRSRPLPLFLFTGAVVCRRCIFTRKSRNRLTCQLAIGPRSLRRDANLFLRGRALECCPFLFAWRGGRAACAVVPRQVRLRGQAANGLSRPLEPPRYRDHYYASCPNALAPTERGDVARRGRGGAGVLNHEKNAFKVSSSISGPISTRDPLCRPRLIWPPSLPGHPSNTLGACSRI